MVRTKDDAVELRGALVDVGQQDSAGLEDGEKLCRSWCGQSGKELVLTLGHLLLKHGCIIDDVLQSVT